MNEIKNAFLKVKQDIDIINKELNFLKESLFETKEQISDIINLLNNLTSQQKNPSKSEIEIPTNNDIDSTTPTHIPTHNYHFKPLKGQNMPFSTGNEGVPADRQTNQQTDRHIKNNSLNDSLAVLDSLDSLKKEIRHKFKRITDQEFLVFSAIYQVEEEFGFADYKTLSKKLTLTESSIRDYVGKLMKKGIPIEKIKINNKIIQLSISQNLKKIAPLPVILQLREL